MATFILIHGAFQGAWVWRETAALLRAAGHEVLTPELTGLGGRAHLLTEGQALSGYVADVVNAVAFSLCGPAVFVGHSFTGLVAAAAAARFPGLARGLVFVDALIPEPGRSFLDMAGPEFAKVLKAHVHDGWLVRPWPLPVFGVAEPELAPAFAARLTSMPLAAFAEPFAFPLPGPDLPRGFIRCTRNPNPFIEAQAAKARAGGYGFTAIDSGHAPMITATQALALALREQEALLGEPAALPPGPAYHAERMLRAPLARSGALPEGTP